MRVYKELKLSGSKLDIDNFKKNAPHLVKRNWGYSKLKGLDKDIVMFEYKGNDVNHAKVMIGSGNDEHGKKNIRVLNIIPMKKSRLSIAEYNDVLDLFHKEVIVPNKEKLMGLTEDYSESDKFEPLDYISSEALNKLENFCNAANKSTGSTHPLDEERWFEFICQTVDDDRIFDYETLRAFLMDEDYWGSKENGLDGGRGRSAWTEEWASELASEYERLCRLLQFYKSR